jgi:hypothetical protein
MNAEEALSEIENYLKLHRVENTRYRPSVAEVARSQTYGIVARRCLPPDLSRTSWKHPALYKMLMDYAKKNVTVPFTSIQVNDNLTCAKHYDKGNVGLSYIVAFGDYTGGELNIEGTLHDIRHKPLLFDGSKQLHGTEVYVGSRYSLVFFTIQPRPSYKDAMPSLDVFSVVEDNGRLKIRDGRNGALYFGSQGLPHPLRKVHPKKN